MNGVRFLGLAGTMTIELIGACPEECLSMAAKAGIRFRNYHQMDELSAQMTIAAADAAKMKKCARRSMCSMEVKTVSGLVPALLAMKLRVGMILASIGMILLVLWLQGHIWFVSVEGNQTVADEEILWALEEEGITFWTSLRDLDLNLIKNQVLAKVPELGWITINTEGGLANVIVREREEKPAIAGPSAPANIVAEKAGLVTEVITTGGTPQIRRGSIVTKDELLISGVTNLDKTMLLTRAEGEVYARTWTSHKAVTEAATMNKVYTGRKNRLFAITFGKKTIKFYKTSGISYEEYDKMSVKKSLTLPGEFILPISLTVTTLCEYETVPQPTDAALAESIMKHSLEAQTVREMEAGTILKQRYLMDCDDRSFSMTGLFECQEEIGTVVEITD